MRTVAEPEAETSLPALLDQVQGGEEVTITRGGEAVARLVRVGRHETLEELRRPQRQAEIAVAMKSIRDRAKALKSEFDWEEIKLWRDEGRR